MSDYLDDLVNLIMSCRIPREERCYEWLLSYIRSLESDVSREFLDDLRKNRSQHLQILKQYPAAAKILEDLDLQIKLRGGFKSELEDIVAVHHRQATFFALGQEYHAAGASRLTLQLLDKLHGVALQEYLALAATQADALCSFLLQLREVVVSGKPRRVILLEVPIGNSLIVHLLSKLLDPPPAALISVSLSRNDKQKDGITRGELLKERIAAFKWCEGDVLLYVDEWNSGANFNSLCSKVRKHLPSGVNLFSAAVLTQDSAHAERYNSFCSDHDSWLAGWNVVGAEWRRVLPSLPTSFHQGRFFFWAENDRMAGYRKMQLHGVIFCSIDETIELLHKDDVALRRAMTQVALETDLELPSEQEDFNGLRANFNECYADYQDCVGQLKSCGNIFEKGPEFYDFDDALQPILSCYHAVAGNRKAWLAINTAVTYLHQFASLNPPGRFYFSHHAPTLVRLSGHDAIIHTTALEFLGSRIQSLCG